MPATYAQFNAQISVDTGGNPALVPETSDKLHGWVRLQPALGGGCVVVRHVCRFEFTYYNIELDKAIPALDAQVQINRCVATLDPVLCGGISRTAGGDINGFANQLLNIGATETKGWDLNIRWVMPETGIGRFSVNWQNTWLDKFIESTETATGFVDTERKGTERGSPHKRIRNGSPRCRLTGDSMTSEPRQRSAIPTRSASRAATSGRSPRCVRDPVGLTNEMDATTYVDLQASWSPSGLAGWTFAVGVNNLFR